ncbi:MAG: hypothetical protein ACYSP9_05830, partial [Planctomycetota bacterium]|jgi:hypothetical protein
MVQKHSHRSIAQLGKDVSEGLSQIDKFAEKIESGMSVADAKKEMRVDSALDFIDNLRNDDGVAGSDPGPQQAQESSSSLNITKAFSDAGWDLSKISRADLEEAQKFTDQQQLTDAMLTRKILGSREREASPSTVVQGDNKPFVGSSVDELMARQEAILSDSALARSAEGQNQLLEIAAEMEKLE